MQMYFTKGENEQVLTKPLPPMR